MHWQRILSSLDKHNIDPTLKPTPAIKKVPECFAASISNFFIRVSFSKFFRYNKEKLSFVRGTSRRKLSKLNRDEHFRDYFPFEHQKNKFVRLVSVIKGMKNVGTKPSRALCEQDFHKSCVGSCARL